MTQGNFLLRESTALVATIKIWGGPFLLQQINGFNSTSDGSIYVQLHDTVDEPTDGSVPVFTMRARPSPNGQFHWERDPDAAGIRFVNGCWVAASTDPNMLTLFGAGVLWVDAEGLQLGPENEIPPSSAKLFRYFAPTTVVGEDGVAVWPDTGDLPHFNLSQPTLEDRPTAFDSDILNDLQVIAAEPDDLPPSIASGPIPPYAGPISFAMVGAHSDERTLGIVGAFGGDVSGYLALVFDANTDHGWLIRTDTGETEIGFGSAFAIVGTALLDGTWEATYCIDWGANQTINGTWTPGDLTHIEAFGEQELGDDGTIQSGEINIWSNTTFSPSQRTARMNALRTTWATPTPNMVFFGPNLTAGEGDPISFWQGTGAGAPTRRLVVQTDPAHQPDAEVATVQLQPLLVDAGTSVDALIATVATVETRSITIAFVMSLQEDSFGAAFYYEDYNSDGTDFAVYGSNTDDPSGVPKGFTFYWLDSGGEQTAELAPDGTEVLSCVISLDCDTGDWEASLQADWDSPIELSGSFGASTSAMFLYLGAFEGVAKGAGATELGEIRIHYVGSNQAARETILDELKATWMPTYETLRWFGPDLTPGGLVSSWIDQSSQHVDCVNASVPDQPNAQTGLNDLTTLFAAANKPLYSAPFGPTGGRALGFAFVFVLPEGSEQGLVELFQDAGDNFFLLQYSTTEDESLWMLWGGPDDSAALTLATGPGIYAGLACIDPSSGQYRVTLSKDWGDPAIIEGFDTAGINTGDVDTIALGYSIPYSSAIETQKCEVRCYVLPGIQTLAEQADILDELIATWKPAELFLRFSNLNDGGVSEGGDAITGWTYSPNLPQWQGFVGGPSHYIPAGEDGSFTAYIAQSNGGYPAIQFNASAALTANTDPSCLVNITIQSGGLSGGLNGDTTVGLGPKDPIPFYLRLERVGTDCNLYQSADGVTFDLLHTFAGFTTADLFPGFTVSNDGGPELIGPMTGEGLVPVSPVIVPVGSNPEVQAGGTPAALNLEKWQVTVANNFASPNSGFQAILVSNDLAGGAALWLHDNSIGLYNLVGAAFETPITWTIGQPITITIDPVGLTLEIQGASSGNGVFDISGDPPPWYDPGTDLYVGCYVNLGDYAWQGTISNVTRAP